MFEPFKKMLVKEDNKLVERTVIPNNEEKTYINGNRWLKFSLNPFST